MKCTKDLAWDLGQDPRDFAYFAWSHMHEPMRGAELPAHWQIGYGKQKLHRHAGSKVIAVATMAV